MCSDYLLLPLRSLEEACRTIWAERGKEAPCQTCSIPDMCMKSRDLQDIDEVCR